MFEILSRARWDQAYDFLASGHPPMIMKLLALNTVFLVMYLVRRTKSEHQIRHSTMMQVQVLLVAANLMIIFQTEIQRFLDRFI